MAVNTSISNFHFWNLFWTVDKSRPDMQPIKRHKYKIVNGECMSGKVYRRKDTGAYFVQWCEPGRKTPYKIYRFRGEKMFSRSTANKLLGRMQADVEDGTFKIEKYINSGWSDVIPMLDEWKKTTFHTLKPGTKKAYETYLKQWIKPFFKKNEVQLHEIKLDVLTSLLAAINRSGKYKQNILYCFHAFLDYCWRSERIVAVPPFPKKREYQITKRPIRWLPEARQFAVLEKIPDEHKPIFYFLKYTMRRPGEAMAFQREDIVEDGFIICRSISARQVIDSTKTGEIHHIACHDDLKPYIAQALRGPIISKFVFTCRTSKNKEKRYSHSILNRIWKAACQAAGEDIDLYSGLKHSTVSQYLNEKGLSKSQVQVMTQHKRRESIDRYGETEIAEQKRLLMTAPLNPEPRQKEG